MLCALQVCCAILSAAFLAEKLEPTLERLHHKHAAARRKPPPMLLAWGDKVRRLHACSGACMLLEHWAVL